MFYLAVLAGIAAWRFVPRPWHPTVQIVTAHYEIASAATRAQTEEMGRMAEILYQAYSNRLHHLPTFQKDHPRLKMRLYRDRDQMRWVNPWLGWAEAFYSKPVCHAYFSAREINPHHWMLHEAVHQLNEEVAHLDLAKWLEEGLAEYFSTSRIRDGRLHLGTIDPNTYPVWWMGEVATTSNLSTNLAAGTVFPLRAVITNRGGPSMRREFNRYYLHWWTLTHFLFEDERHADSAVEVLKGGGGLRVFEEKVGPPEKIQEEWHQHVLRLKTQLP
jgi:hypothetical protein